ncbi:AlpA family transcriptional regulator [Novosphingobium sp. B1]|uniref:helix-turn-helix transcriptional regulator n=1 Tax=Novosphingobium sp. B1 TaxID=1938756 RepID=UPI0009FEC086|nr:AlpA family phage regulatory protein [Novosphingobium sp. B1]
MTIQELLTCQEVMQLTGIRSRTTIWRRIQRGAFPAPLDFGSGRLRWKSIDISDWVNSLPKRRY